MTKAISRNKILEPFRSELKQVANTAVAKHVLKAIGTNGPCKYDESTGPSEAVIYGGHEL